MIDFFKPLMELSILLFSVCLCECLPVKLFDKWGHPGKQLMQNPGVIPLFSSTLWLALTPPLLSNGFRETFIYLLASVFNSVALFKET